MGRVREGGEVEVEVEVEVEIGKIGSNTTPLGLNNGSDLGSQTVAIEFVVPRSMPMPSLTAGKAAASAGSR